MTQEIKINDPAALINDAPPLVKEVLKEVIKLEREKIFQEKPQVKSDIVNIIKRIVNENSINSIS